MPKLSVIVPIYGVEKYLRECLDSIVNQTLKDIEIILVDDGKVVSIGKHDELYENVPMYRDIVDLQKLEDQEHEVIPC